MNENHIFVDTNILIGAFAGIQSDERCLQYLYSLRGKKLFISSLSIAQFVSLFQKKRTFFEIAEHVRYLLSKFVVISFTEKDIETAIAIEHQDMEDTMQYVLSQKLKCLNFITNNKKDFRYFHNIDVFSSSTIRAIEN